MGGSAGIDVDLPIPARPPEQVEVPLSALQERMWYLCTAYTGDSSPIVFLSYRLRGALDIDAWQGAVSSVVDRHEGLRVLFALREGGPVQVVGPAHGIDTEHIDLTDLPASDRLAAAEAEITTRAKALLDLVNGPLVRSCLIRLGDADHIWCLTMHHLLADGTSVEIIAQELRAYYRAAVTGDGDGLPQGSPVGYPAFALWQRASPGDEDDLRHWRERLAGVPALELPTDTPRPAEKGTRGREYHHSFAPALTERLEHFVQAEYGTLFMVLLAGLGALLGGHSGQSDFCIGTPIAGRTRVELERTVGLFSNFLPLRADLSGDPTFRQLVRRTRGEVVDALDRQGVPFGRIVAELDLPRDRSRTEVFQVLFILHTEVAGEREELPGVEVAVVPVGSPQILHDLVLDTWRDRETIAIELRYDSALFTEETIAAMAARFESLLLAAVDNPDARLSTLLHGWGRSLGDAR